MGKKITNILCWGVCIVFLCVGLGFLTVFFGNPVSHALARSSADRYLKQYFFNQDFEIIGSGFDLKTGGYYIDVISPSSRDSHFTIYCDALGRYQHDTHYFIQNGTNTFSRLEREYWDLAECIFGSAPFDISIGFGELRAADYAEVFHYTNSAGEVKEYTLWQDYGIDMSTLKLDADYDIQQLGRDHGKLCVYIHDPEVTVERAAEVLLEFKAYMDVQGLPFHAIDFTLCEPRNAEGQLVGQQITLLEFLYIDIYEEGMVERVEVSWNITQEHYAIQDGEKVNSELEYLTEFQNPPDSLP